MLHKTQGIVLRSIKYGDSSLITTIYTHSSGLQTYIVQGVRSSKAGKNRAAYFQPGVLLDLVVTQQPLKNMQRIREYQAAYIYNTLRQDVIKNSIALFSLELLLRLLPEHAAMPALFEFAYHYFVVLDKMPLSKVANFPLFFIIQCSRELGYDLKGSYSEETPHLNCQEGGFTEHTPSAPPYIHRDDAYALSLLLRENDYDALDKITMNAAMRIRITDWFIMFLQLHTQHMGAIKSLSVLRAILH